jgi:hypothetical protein
VLEAKRKALETVDLESRVAALDRTLPLREPSS